jgi:hypothetical protein
MVESTIVEMKRLRIYPQKRYPVVSVNVSSIMKTQEGRSDS